MIFQNSYEDAVRAASYSRLEFPNTYFLAYRDLPSIIGRYLSGGRALDFGCGTGRSTRFLSRLGFQVSGVDISAEMVSLAKAADPSGNYQVISDGDFSAFSLNSFDLILSVFTFDNIPGFERRTKLMEQLGKLLKPSGIMVLLDSTPEIYTHEWASFSTCGFPENRNARSGEKVQIVMTDVTDRRPVEDIIWFDQDYRACFEKAGLKLIRVEKPLGRPTEPFEWKDETKVAPWVIYVVKPKMPIWAASFSGSITVRWLVCDNRVLRIKTQMGTTLVCDSHFASVDRHQREVSGYGYSGWTTLNRWVFSRSVAFRHSFLGLHLSAVPSVLVFGLSPSRFEPSRTKCLEVYPTLFAWRQILIGKTFCRPEGHSLVLPY